MLTTEMSQRDWRVGPPLGLDFSPAYDITSPLIMRWIFYLLETARVSFILISPPCTTFSIAANPPYRSRKLPRGFDPLEPRTRLGNACAFRGLAILLKCKKTGTLGMLETPRSSIMTALEEWERLASLDGFRSVWASSCAFGSPHLKLFLFFVYGFDPSVIHRKCTCTKKHLPVKGKHAKASATQASGLVAEIGAMIHGALRRRKRLLLQTDVYGFGLERVSSTDLALSLDWRTDQVWTWKNEVHINILEASL